MKNFNRLGVIALILGIFLTSCMTNTLKSPQSEKAKKPEGTALYFYKTRFANLPDTAKFVFSGTTLESTPEIKLFYQRRLFRTAWTKDYTPTAEADSLIELIKNSKKLALVPRLYHPDLIQKVRARFTDTLDLFDQLENTCNLELLLTNASVLITRHLNRGFLNIDTIDYPIKPRLNKLEITTLLNDGIKSNNVISSILNIQPQNHFYKQLLSAYNWYLEHSGMDSIIIHIPDPEKDSLKAYERAKQILIKNGFLIFKKNTAINNKRDFEPSITKTKISPDHTPNNDSLFINALKIFQRFNGLNQDGKIGKYTRKALQKTNINKYEEILLTIEKLRWEYPLPKKYIFVNIPTFKLRYLANDTIKTEHKVVVGLPYKQTPVMTDTMEYFITFPDWNVPVSITTHEILPKMQSDSSYLQRNNYVIYDKNLNAVNVNDLNIAEMDAGTIKKYYIKQSGGNSNALGTIKFIFPNQYDVYIHDTPSKRFFHKDIRAFSHGCVRLQKPWEFAEFLLTQENRKDFIDTLMHFKTKKWQRYVSLRPKIPVLFRYFSVEADEKNNIYYYADIYNRDKELLPELRRIYHIK